MRVHVTLTDEEVAAIDAARREGVNRSAWIAGAIRIRLRGHEQEQIKMKALAAQREVTDRLLRDLPKEQPNERNEDGRGRGSAGPGAADQEGVRDR